MDVISPATDRPLERGNVLMLDTGLVWDGYFCDFDRNFAIGDLDASLRSAHARLIEATQAGAEAARAGALASDLYRVMDQVLTGGQAPPGGGRMGHGLGIQLTEPPSLMPSDHTVLEADMVITLEPWIGTRNGHIMVHEENLVITPSGARFLSSSVRTAVCRRSELLFTRSMRPKPWTASLAYRYAQCRVSRARPPPRSLPHRAHPSNPPLHSP